MTSALSGAMPTGSAKVARGLRHYNVDHKLSGRKLALATGINHARMARLLNGTFDFTLDEVVTIASVLGLPWEMVAGGIPDDAPEPCGVFCKTPDECPRQDSNLRPTLYKERDWRPDDGQYAEVAWIDIERAKRQNNRLVRPLQSLPGGAA